MGKESKKMQKIVYLGNFQIPNQQNKMDLFECSCGYKIVVIKQQLNQEDF